MWKELKPGKLYSANLWSISYMQMFQQMFPGEEFFPKEATTDDLDNVENFDSWVIDNMTRWGETMV